MTYYYQHAEMQREQDRWQVLLEDQIHQAESQAIINYQAMENLYNEQKAKSLLDNAMIAKYSREIERLGEEVNRLNNELVFYEEMIPAGPDGVVSLRSFEARQEGRYISFKVLLSISGREASQAFSGRLQFTATGEKDGEEQTIDLYPEVLPLEGPTLDGESLIPNIVQNKPDSGGVDLKTAQMNPILELNFSRIQRREGLLGIPFGFSPKSITVKVLEGNSVKLSKMIEL